MTLTRPLSIKEVYYCLYLLKKLNQKEDIIQKFMKKAKQENSKQNIIAQYYFNIPKIEYYCQNSQDLESELKELKDYFKEYTTSLEEDKNAWEELLIEQLKELKLAMPNDGVYENEMVKKLVNKKEG